MTALLGNLATDNVIPGILVDIINIKAEGGTLVVAMDIVKEYLAKRFAPVFGLQNISADDLYKMSADEVAKAIGAEQTVENILKNVGLILPNGTLTVAAIILMGEYPQRLLPVFTARCVSYIGNSIGGSEFRDKSGSDADGNAVHLYKFIMTFLMRILQTSSLRMT